MELCKNVRANKPIKVSQLKATHSFAAVAKTTKRKSISAAIIRSQGHSTKSGFSEDVDNNFDQDFIDGPKN